MNTHTHTHTQVHGPKNATCLKKKKNHEIPHHLPKCTNAFNLMLIFLRPL